MKDYDNFFDEMIDVDDEAEREEMEYSGEGEDFEDGDDDDDDDDALVVRTAVLTKNEMLALLSLKSSDEGGQIVRFDPREPLPAIQRYESDAEALKWFRRSLATSRRNGWPRRTGSSGSASTREPCMTPSRPVCSGSSRRCAASPRRRSPSG